MKHTGFTLSRNEWLVMELVRQLGQEPPRLGQKHHCHYGPAHGGKGPHPP